MGLETHIKLCVAKPDFLGKFFCPQNWENGSKKGQKQGFLNLLEDLVINFYWSWSVILLANLITGFLNQLYLWKKMMKRPHFLHVDTDSWKLEVDWKILGWAWSKMDVGILFSGLWKCQGEMNGINLFLVCSFKFRNSKSSVNFLVVVVKNGRGLLGRGTLKSALSRELVDEMSWFFAADTNLGKLKVTLIITS